MATPSPDFELLAASLRADQQDIAGWIEALSVKFVKALPGRAFVRRGGIFGNGRIEGVHVDLASWRYSLYLRDGQLVAERFHQVRGIVLKTEQITVDAWITDISALLVELAATSAREAEAIRRLLS